MQAHPEYVESLYKQYLEDPSSLDSDWQLFFKGYELGNDRPIAQNPQVNKEIKTLNLINGYRQRGHFFTKTNPVRGRRKYTPNLDIENFGLEKSDLNTTFEAGEEIGLGTASLKKIVEHLDSTYCHSIGAEYVFVRRRENIRWLQSRIEKNCNTPNFSKDKKKHILSKLAHAVSIENFLHKKYVGQKRFSLSGVESVIPGLDTIIQKGAELGVVECVIGMAHRGRLNVLANVMQKSYYEIFNEFEEGSQVEGDAFAGDVKYHLGYSSDVKANNGVNIHLNLIPNPSHLEAVAPVTEGVVRAKIDKRYKGDSSKIVPILIHGDAAIAAQGIVYEVSQMSKLPGYKTGGTIHLVLNNQVGFTTNYMDGRSSTYCTDIAKVTLSPVFHVNADDVEAVVHAIEIAMEYRQTFHTDVYIDLLGYRRYGHNEADEPKFTQPKLYDVIAKHPNAFKIYEEKLKKEKSFTAEEIKEVESAYRNMLQEKLDTVRREGAKSTYTSFKADWEGYRRPNTEDFHDSPDTSVPLEKLREIGTKILSIPEDFKVFPKIRKIYNNEKDLLLEKGQCDWAIAEYLAYGSLLTNGCYVRLSGQDSKRGTFAHRHSVILRENEEEYIPLNNITEDQATFSVYNSLLSEYGVMGFEFGYASASPKALTIWEAQFGDFVNGAQIIIDQFLCCSETKWKRNNGLVLYLPHGYEGQGPEHSSARIERFLELCAYNNMQIVNCTSAANFFHVLRRHMLFPFRLPLVIFTPKSLLRNQLCYSSLESLATGKFEIVLDDDTVKEAKKIKTVLFCSGKVCYDLLKYKEENKKDEFAVLRLEQLYPLPRKRIQELLDKYSGAKQIWVQEEPNNMGPWSYIHRKWTFGKIECVSRRDLAAPATGSNKQHLLEQEQLVEKAFE